MSGNACLNRNASHAIGGDRQNGPLDRLHASQKGFDKPPIASASRICKDKSSASAASNCRPSASNSASPRLLRIARDVLRRKNLHVFFIV